MFVKRLDTDNIGIEVETIIQTTLGDTHRNAFLSQKEEEIKLPATHLRAAVIMIVGTSKGRVRTRLVMKTYVGPKDTRMMIL